MYRYFSVKELPDMNHSAIVYSVTRGGVRVFKTKWFMRYAKRERIGDEGLCAAIKRAERGIVDADLGGGLIKQRVPRAGQGP
jgi:hypothetical protein